MKSKGSLAKNCLHFLLTFVLILTAANAFKAQTSNNIDAGFNPVLRKPPAGIQNIKTLSTVQPDGKLIAVYKLGGNGYFTPFTAPTYTIRYNTDGTIDDSFKCTGCSALDNITSIFALPDGKILMGGQIFNPVNNGTNAKVIRLNTDGSLDNAYISFTSAPFTTQYRYAVIWAIQPDGKVFVTVQDNDYYPTMSLYRLNPDGSLDKFIFGIQMSRYLRLVTKVFVLPDGKFYVSGNYYPLARFNADGSKDETFQVPTLNNVPGGKADISDFEVLSDGKIIVTGFFTTINGVARNGNARLDATGAVDTSFAEWNYSGALEQTADGKFIISDPTGLQKVNVDKVPDPSFVSPPNVGYVDSLQADAAGKIYFRSSVNNVPVFGRLNANGGLETYYTNNILPASVTKLVVQSDNKVIAAGDFITVNGVTRYQIARFNADGSIDNSFNVPSGFNATPNLVAVQPNGKVLVGGAFTNYADRSYLVRFNADGSIDSSFTANTGNRLDVIAVQPDGKILIAGQFITFTGSTQKYLARLNADGSLDTSFNPTFSANNSSTPYVTSILVQTDGKIIVGGTFASVNGISRSNIVRLNADGTVDASFNTIGVGTVVSIARQSSGKYIVADYDAVRRLNLDGSGDDLFRTVSARIQTLAIQADDSIVIGGTFTAVYGLARNNLGRLSANGAIDSAFVPSGTNGAVASLVVQADGKTLVGGSFTQIGGVDRTGLARVNVTPLVPLVAPTLFDFDGDRKADITVYRPNEGRWFSFLSMTNSLRATQFGIASDVPVTADYDGDGITDIAVWRAGTRANFYISQGSSYRTEQFGTTGDDPSVVGDWDGDGKADVAVYRSGATSGAQSYFYYRPSNTPNADFTQIPWGISGDRAVRGDFTGDGKLDAAVFRPSNQTWYIKASDSAGYTATQFGLATDILTPADYDGDGKTDIAVYRPSNGNWYRLNSSNGQFVAAQFGIAEDKPVPADYDGDGKADLAVFRPSQNTWYEQRSTAGFTAMQFGTAGDIPVPNIFFH